MQGQLPLFQMINLSKKSQIGFPIYAQPDKSGAMNIEQLHDFFAEWVSPYFESRKLSLILLDFSLVKFWDIAAVLWLIIALHCYKRLGMQFLLRLPEPNSDMSDLDQKAFQKSADFLRRWRFDRGLRNISSDVSKLLVPEQQDYFEERRQKFYLETKLETTDRITETLISKRLAEIKNLGDLRGISDEEISKSIVEFQSARIGDILLEQCKIDKRQGDLFSDVILTEGLFNIKEHPNATIGMFAVSILGASNELILAVADNGESIPQTIYPTYLEKGISDEEEKKALPAKFNREEISFTKTSEITHYATLPGVSRKPPNVKNRGMGLHYIKKHALLTFGGELLIIAGGVCHNYSKALDNYVITQPRYRWQGNLLRISLRIQNR